MKEEEKDMYGFVVRYRERLILIDEEGRIYSFSLYFIRLGICFLPPE